MEKRMFRRGEFSYTLLFVILLAILLGSLLFYSIYTGGKTFLP